MISRHNRAFTLIEVAIVIAIIAIISAIVIPKLIERKPMPAEATPPAPPRFSVQAVQQTDGFDFFVISDRNGGHYLWVLNHWSQQACMCPMPERKP